MSDIVLDRLLLTTQRILAKLTEIHVQLREIGDRLAQRADKHREPPS